MGFLRSGFKIVCQECSEQKITVVLKMLQEEELLLDSAVEKLNQWRLKNVREGCNIVIARGNDCSTRLRNVFMGIY